MFFPGCSMIAHSPDLVMSALKYLRGVWPDIGLSCGCCARPALALGEGIFLRNREALHRRLLESGVRGLVVCCPNCAVTLGDGDLKIVSIWRVLRDHAPAAEMKMPEIPPLVLHDPCPTRRDPELHESVRHVLSRIGVAFEEYPDNRERTLCCGRVNMLMVLDPERGREMLRRRIEQSSRRNVVTYCYSCVDAFKSAGLRSLHGLDLALSPAESIDPIRRDGLLRGWRNRWITARRAAALMAGWSP
ncbi:MAG: (Fe-S)-binding protein [Synergistaceae bacterium]|nr:(Fe-S)-binding protein [Synergistaceae bacterium]